MSLAIDREQIVDALYLGYADLPQTINYREYGPEGANRLLDEIGLDKRDADGWRLGPDGKRFTIPFVVTEMTGEQVPVAEMVRRMWEDVGIHTTLKQIESGLWSSMNVANTLKAFTYWAHYS